MKKQASSEFNGKPNDSTGLPTSLDDLPRMQGEDYKGQTVMAVVEIPNNVVKPLNGRIFAIEQDPGEMKTEGGVIIPTTYQAPEAKGAVTRNLRRYYAVDVADDVTLPVCRGDEIFPFIPQEAENWSFPVIIDWAINKAYLVFHESELAGYSHTDQENKEENGLAPHIAKAK